MSETTIKQLSTAAVKAADEKFFAMYPEMVGKSIRPNDPSHRQYVQAWNTYYRAANAAEEAKKAAIMKALALKPVTTKKSSGFTEKVAGATVQPCPNAKAIVSEPKKPEPKQPPCNQNVKHCKPKTTIQCQHGRTASSSNQLEVVPEPTSSEKLTLSADIDGGCGEPVEWVVSGFTNKTIKGNKSILEIKPLAFRHAAISPLGRWAMKAAPNVYRISPRIKCGSVSSPFTIKVYPGEQCSIKISPASWSFYKKLEEGMNTLCDFVFGKNRLNFLFPKGEISIAAQWKEHTDHTAFYQYDIQIGLNPLFGLESRIPLLDALRSLAVPAKVVDWTRRYLGDILYIAAQGKLSTNGNLTRVAPDRYTHWTASANGEISIVLGAELGRSKGVLAFEASGESGVALKMVLDPKPQDPSNKVFKADLLFSGLKSKISIKVAGGFLSFDEEYQIISSKPLLSNHQLSIFD
ncbi:hypothetical protein [Rheinheimera maricola]|uniref:Uncharacterized protein n=1 Tax=Rheinheimera maricola TaxID=2793282 RepID=A0ABS7XFX0_9GAMM|nr:hypothetical protein [Rheinheimera maricola]MBZ9613427.1 hypothetical protein [Rheinheimera maricola]